ncbi:MAG TPA: GAF domain-containing protein [Chloroflexota bacterium]|jgi:signal transduction histidine kinase/CheY-like chemotaxis protein
MATILLADNEPWLRVLARATLAPTHRLLEAWDAQQALDLARREHPRLVLLDGAAPEMNAAALCQQLKADPATHDAVIVLLTPGGKGAAGAAPSPDCADLRLTKPFGPTALLNTVGQALPAAPAPSLLTAVPLQPDGLNDEPEELDQAVVYARELSTLYEAARDRAARFRLLVELGKDLVAARGLDAVLRLALERATAFSGHDGGSVMLLASPEGPLVVAASTGAQAVVPGTVVEDLARGVARQALQVGRPLVLEGAADEVGTAWHGYKRAIPSSICLPLVTPGSQTLGVLALKSTTEVLHLDDHDLDLLQLLAAQLAAVVESARLHERLQRSLDALLALHEAGQVLGASLEADEIGQRLLEIAGRVAGLDAAVISVHAGAQPTAPLRVWHAVGPEALWRAAQRSPVVRAARREALASGQPRLVHLRARGDGSRVAWCLPLRVQDRVRGVLEVYGPESLVGESSGEILGSLALQAASALENARLYRELTEREQQLQALVGRLLVAQEEERRRVAYDVHDGVAQVAAATHQHLQAYARFHRPRSPAARDDLERALELARRTVGGARRVIADLRPTVLDDFGLATALRRQVEALRAEHWEVSYDDALGAERLPPAVETALYRVAQEALSNVRKHAGTTRVHLGLRRKGRAARLEVQDWGRGFHPTAARVGAGPGERVGLPGMQERVALLGGRCRVHSRPGAGTRVVAEVPVGIPLADPPAAAPAVAAAPHG